MRGVVPRWTVPDFQWKPLGNLVLLANENVSKRSSKANLDGYKTSRKKVDLADTIKDGAAAVGD